MDGFCENEDTFLFTSESVGEGHPDKLCDQISDAILDAYLAIDPSAKVAVETMAKASTVICCGEVRSTGKVDIVQVARDTIREIGYDDVRKGLDYATCEVMLAIEDQSPDIAEAVHVNRSIDDLGAGDQGIMFGYATDETPSYMPLTLELAHALNRKVSELRRTRELAWARPDSKTQVTILYRNDNGACVPQRVHTVVMSVQHDEFVSIDQIHEELKEKVISQVIPSNLIDGKTIYHLNPSGRFVVGGPKDFIDPSDPGSILLRSVMGDAGLTGRKIIVDTYGGWGAHGGGAFSGKDPSKVDRSAGYAARWIAKSLVHAKLCRRVTVQISYAIGIKHPLSVYVNSYGTGIKTDRELTKIVCKNFDLSPGGIIKALDLQKPIYCKTAAYGHFGRDEFKWEIPKELDLNVD